MNYQKATLTLSPGHHAPGLVVGGAMTLRELVESQDIGNSRYLLVATCDGQLAGIVNTAEILKCATCDNDVERNRWLEKTIESLVPWALHAHSFQTSARRKTVMGEPDRSEMTLSAVMDDETITLLADRDDVFVRWSQIENLLQNMATDPLTGLCTRSVFERLLKQELARSRRQDCPVALLLFDLDRLKEINDQQGHAEGDHALQMLASTITDNLRSYDIVARHAGDEFTSICFDCSAHQIERPVKRILNAVNGAELSNGHPLSVSIGVAIAPSPPSPDSYVEMFALADDCLYRAKNGGRNRAYLGFVDSGDIEELVVGAADSDTGIVPDGSALQKCH